MAKTKLYTFYMGPYKACVQNGVSGSYMDVVFELVAHEESGQVYHTVYQGRPTTVLRVSRVCERY